MMRLEVLIGSAEKKFDEAGKLTDEDAKKFLSQLLQNLVELTRLYQHAQADKQPELRSHPM